MKESEPETCYFSELPPEWCAHCRGDKAFWKEGEL